MVLKDGKLKNNDVYEENCVIIEPLITLRGHGNGHQRGQVGRK